jgi:hypothetical protein
MNLLWFFTKHYCEHITTPTCGAPLFYLSGRGSLQGSEAEDDSDEAPPGMPHAGDRLRVFVSLSDSIN